MASKTLTPSPKGIELTEDAVLAAMRFLNRRSGIVAEKNHKASVDEQKAIIENEFLGVLLSAMKKGMTPEEFFAVADATLSHLRGKTQNEIVERIINNTASSGDVEKMIADLSKK